MASVFSLAPPPIDYPEDDGEPMSDNTLQFRWIMTIQGGLDALFAQNPNVFVAGNLLWYPIEGDNVTRQAPDVMVVFGRPKGERGSYKQWEEGDIPPQVVFEVLSPGNRPTEMTRKFSFYTQHGVEEYYLYDPDRNEFFGWLRKGIVLEEIANLNDWVSPRLGVRFLISAQELQIIRPDDQPLVSYVEMARHAEEARQRAHEERQRAERLAAKLRAAGIDPEA